MSNNVIFYIRPHENFEESTLLDSNGTTVDSDFISDTSGNSPIYSVKWNGEHRMVNHITHGRAVRDKNLIKIDLNKKRMRQVSASDIGNHEPSTPTNEQSSQFDPTSIVIETTKLRNINFDPRLFVPIKTGTYLDEFVSHKGGFMPGTNIMVTGDPGVGKSSNLMDVLINVKDTNPRRRVLYISSEMNEIDVKEFEKFYPGIVDIDFLYLGNYITDPDINIKPYQALLSVLNQGWDMVVIDSLIETEGMIQDDLGLTLKKSEKWLLDLMSTHNQGHNERNLFTAFLCIQQRTKGGQYVGSKRLEHMTSAFLQLNWSKKEKGRRYMVFEKNRKGKEKIELYYSFAKSGGIAYDENRHRKETMIMERLGTPSDFNLEEVGVTDFERIFSKDDSVD